MDAIPLRHMLFSSGYIVAILLLCHLSGLDFSYHCTCGLLCTTHLYCVPGKIDLRNIYLNHRCWHYFLSSRAVHSSSTKVLYWELSLSGIDSVMIRLQLTRLPTSRVGWPLHHSTPSLVWALPFPGGQCQSAAGPTCGLFIKTRWDKHSHLAWDWHVSNTVTYI